LQEAAQVSRYPLFDRKQVMLADIAKRGHVLRAEQCLPLAPPEKPFSHHDFPALLERIAAARRAERPVIVMMGAHLIKLGLSRFVIDLVKQGVITHLATNGAGIIHDFELACFGGTSEEVAHWIRRGQFGLWQQTSQLNELVATAARAGQGIGEAVGAAIAQGPAPYRELSLAAAAWRVGAPLTVHVGIGCDIVHAHPNCDGGAWGRASDIDFLIFAHGVAALEGGALLNIGTAVTGPEVFLKALAMARNVAQRQQSQIRRFTTAVFDLVPLPEDWRSGAPGNEQPLYYYRPWKTLLQRTVADGGESFYFCGDHRQTIPTLWQGLTERLILAAQR
jgi:hypothetical protein